MKKRLMEKLHSLTKEDFFVSVFAATFFVGVWYALPMVNTITDVWAFGGGVLRAMDAHTILPGGDVEYGTISFFQNYVAMAVALGFGFLFTGFDIEALKTVLVLNPSYSLIPSRIVSILTSGVLLVVVYRFLQVHITSSWWRVALLVLVFANVLTTLLARSGKMWMLSTALGVVSFIYLYQALTQERQSGIPGRASLISVITAFLATANFPFAAVFLINIPIIFLFFSKAAKSLKRLLYIVLTGAAICIAIVALNFQNTFELVSLFIVKLFQPSTEAVIAATPDLSFVVALLVNVRHVVEAFPLLLLALVVVIVSVSRLQVRNKTLAYLALTYGVIWIIMAAVLFRTDHGLALNVRHIFPVGFFLLFLIVAYGEPARRVAISFFSIGLAIYVYTLVLLSVPTTYNDVSDFIVSQYGDEEIRIDEHIFELTLPMNKASYEIFAEKHCGSTCSQRRMLDSDISFKPLVVTDHTNKEKLDALPSADIVVHERSIPGCIPVAYFGNVVPDNEVFDIDINLGRMLMPSFYTLHQLGKNMYVYEVVTCPAANVSGS